MNRARVVISATNIAPGNDGGAATFVWGLVGGLSQDPGLTLAVLAAPDVVPAWLTGVEILPVGQVAGSARLVRDYARLPRAYRSWRPDLLHYPHEWCPSADVPVVTTVQNIGWMHPASVEEFGLRGRLMRGATRRTFRRAASWTAVSPLAADLFAELTGAPRRQIAVLPEGCDPVSPEAAGEAERHGWLLVVGPYEYKNARLALDAYAWAASRAVVPPLFVAGIDGVAGRPGGVPGVQFLGWVGHAQLQRRMKTAALCIFPSAVESFGLPAVESVTAGTPCIVQAGTAMEQWLGECVVTFDGTWTDLGRTLLAGRWPDPAGLPLEHDFDWPAVGGAWARHYESVLASRP